jgi:hypothetical protein
MSYQVITDFRQGLDARKYKLALPPGTLLQCDNAHITQGGEIEKRKAFVQVSIPAAYTGIHYGMQPAADGIYLFGTTLVVQATATRDRVANVARLKLPFASGTFIVGNVVNISGVGGTAYNGNGIVITAVTNAAGDQWISYASVAGNEALNTVDTGGQVILAANVLPAPLIYEILPNANTYGGVLSWSFGPAMTAVLSSTIFSGAPFALAKYSDGSIYPFYGSALNRLIGPPANQFPMANCGVVVSDAVAGLQLQAPGFPVNGSYLLVSLMLLAAASGSYTSTTTDTGVEHTYSIPTTLNGTPYTVSTSIITSAGTLVAAQQTSGTASTASAQAVGSFEIVSAGNGTQATGTTTNTSGANMNDGDTLTIGTTVYRFKNAMAQAYDVKIGGTRQVTLASFAAAINGTGVTGTDYFAGTVAHPTVRCVALNTTSAPFTLSLMAINGGTAGNALAFSSTAGTRLVVSAATLTGAVDSKINQIVINGTNLLAAAVAFTTNETTTAAAVATAINANPASGYQATSSGKAVNILVQVAGATPNGRAVQVQCQGTVVCGTGAFSLTGSGFTLDFCKANGVDLMNDAILLANESVMTYPQVTGQVLSDFCRAVANNLNSGTATHGYLAHCPLGSVSIYLCKATTTSTDSQQVLDVSVTASVGQSGSAIPVTVTPLAIALDINAVAIGNNGTSDAVTATPIGGVSPFVFKWVQQGSNAIGVKANSAKSAQTTFSATALNTTLKRQLVAYNNLPASRQPAYLTSHPALAAYLSATTTNQVTFVCVVTDALGEQATSDAVFVTVLSQ